MYAQYMCILLYVKLILCNSIPLIYCQLGRGVDVCLLYVHSVICENVLGVMICHRCIVNWSGGYMYPHYMCI